jgi:lipopolysaccharide heptosyltransferase II
VHLRILIIRLSSLGDIVLTIPLLNAIRAKYPDATIDFLTKNEYVSLVQTFTAVSNVHGLDTKTRTAAEHLHRELRAKHYDHVFDLHNNWRSIKIRKELAPSIHIINKRTLKRWILVKFKTNLLRNEPDIVGRYFEVASILELPDTGKGAHIPTASAKTNRVAFAPGAKHWNKRWPTEYYIEIGKELAKRGYIVAIFGSASESTLAEEIIEEVPNAINECGKYELHELPDAIARCALFIGNDSGLMHIAAATSMPTIAIYGPTVREFGFMPRNENVKILEVNGLDCRPCTTIGLDHCPKGHLRCMKDTTPKDVLSALNF